MVVLVLEVRMGGLGTFPCCSVPWRDACSLQKENGVMWNMGNTPIYSDILDSFKLVDSTFQY